MVAVAAKAHWKTQSCQRTSMGSWVAASKRLAGFSVLKLDRANRDVPMKPLGGTRKVIQGALGEKPPKAMPYLWRTKTDSRKIMEPEDNGSIAEDRDADMSMARLAGPPSSTEVN